MWRHTQCAELVVMGFAMYCLTDLGCNGLANRCIKWLKEMNPPGSVQVVLQEVLELAAKTFVPDKRYKSDLRYLKVWIQYVRFLP
jgi:hypothetical protein